MPDAIRHKFPIYVKRVFSTMSRKFWKLFSVLFAFFVILDPSHGTSNKKGKLLNKLAIANNDLGLKLYRLLVEGTTENVFFSPFSISSAFGMLFAGCKGNTAKQLRSALGYDAANLKSKCVPSAFDKYLDIILQTDQSPDPEYILNLANELLLAKNFEVYPKYKEKVQDFFHAFIVEVDFMKDSAKIVQEVNDFVKEKTNGKISELLSDVDPSTAMLILNAIYFKGTWKTQFEKNMTKNEDFYNDGSNEKAKEVPLMHLTEKFPYASVGDLQALELPYKGDNISMLILLPQECDGLTDLENNITPEKIQDIQKQMYETEVMVTLPKFKVEYKRTLNSDFEELGATDIFNPDSADFSGITPGAGICVNQVIHKAVIEVNEEGSEAAAVTGIGIIPTAVISYPEFTADHPFMYTIYDKRYNIILFVGRVTEL